MCDLMDVSHTILTFEKIAFAAPKSSEKQKSCLFLVYTLNPLLLKHLMAILWLKFFPRKDFFAEFEVDTIYQEKSHCADKIF